MLISESRAASNVRHRIQAPNSEPRSIKIIGLGAGGAEIVQRVSERGFRCVEAISLAPAATVAHAASSAQVLDAIATGGNGLARALEGANMIFVLAKAGDDISFARVIRGIARGMGVLVTGIMLHSQSGGPTETEPDLDVLRSASDMLVISSDESYVLEMLGALGA